MHCSRVEAFRHRAKAIIADHPGVSHVYLLVTLTGRGERMPRHKGHPPRIVPDIAVGARGGEAGGGEFGDHLAFAVAL